MKHESAKVWALSTLACIAIILFCACAQCRGQEIDLRGQDAKGTIWRKHAVCIADGFALTTYHGNTGHCTYEYSVSSDWRIIKVSGKYPIAQQSKEPLKIGEFLWCRGKWAQVIEAGHGEFYTLHRVVPGDSGSGLYRKDGTCAGVVTHRTPLGCRAVRW